MSSFVLFCLTKTIDRYSVYLAETTSFLQGDKKTLAFFRVYAV